MKKRSMTGVCFALFLLQQIGLTGSAFAQSWEGAREIEFPGTRGGNPQIAMNSTGTALAIWRDVTSGSMRVNRYTFESGWSTASSIQSAGPGRNPQVAIDNFGMGMAVWARLDPPSYTMYNIYASRYYRDIGWGAPVLIESHDAGNADMPQIAVASATGEAVAVWHQFAGTRSNVYANRFTPVDGWGGVAMITDNAGDAFDPQVASDAAGNAIVVWRQSDGTSYSIWTNRFTRSGGWGVPALLESNTGEATAPEIAMDPDGNAIAVWAQSDGVRNNIWSNRFTVGSGWGTAVLIESNDGDAWTPKITMNAAGDAFAVWGGWDPSAGTLTGVTFANRYTVAAGWGTPVRIGLGSSDPQVAVDAMGNAVAVWYQKIGGIFLGAAQTFANRYTAGSGWGTAVQLNTVSNGLRPQIATDATTGSAIAIWLQGQQSVMANRFSYVPTGCPEWWVHGSHNWSWKGIPIFGIEVSLSAASWTTWGTSTASCGAPLNVDVLQASIGVWRSPHPLAPPDWTSANTGTNTSVITTEDDGLVIPAGDLPCGAEAGHRATKNGVSWSYTTKSGCRD